MPLVLDLWHKCVPNSGLCLHYSKLESAFLSQFLWISCVICTTSPGSDTQL